MPDWRRGTVGLTRLPTTARSVVGPARYTDAEIKQIVSAGKNVEFIIPKNQQELDAALPTADASVLLSELLTALPRALRQVAIPWRLPMILSTADISSSLAWRSCAATCAARYLSKMRHTLTM